MEKKSKSNLKINNLVELEAFQQKLNTMAAIMEKTANWWSPRITKIAEKIKNIKDKEDFNNESVLDDLQLQLNHLIKKSEWEQRENTKFQETVKEFNKIREKLIFSNLASSLGSKDIKNESVPSGKFTKL